MPNPTQLKRGPSANIAAAVLLAGEPAFTLDNGKLYIGNGSGKVLINPDNVASATKLETPRNFSVTGDFSAGPVAFDGTAPVSLNIVLPNVLSPGTYTKLTVNAKGQITVVETLTADDIPSLTLAKISDAGTAASKTAGNAVGNVPMIEAGGKLNAGIMPSLSITDTFPVADEVEMLALTCEVGDVAVRNDGTGSWILKASPASILANWIQLKAPTDVVTSVNSRTGAIVLTASDVGLGNVTNESKATMFTNSAFTGIPTAPTAAAITNTTQLATTAYVKSQNYIANGDTIDGGTF